MGQSSMLTHLPKMPLCPIQPLMSPRLLPIWNLPPWIAFTMCRYSLPFTSRVWLPPKRSVIFVVKREHLAKYLMVYLPYKYEWDGDQNDLVSKEPQYTPFRRLLLLQNTSFYQLCKCRTLRLSGLPTQLTKEARSWRVGSERLFGAGVKIILTQERTTKAS